MKQATVPMIRLHERAQNDDVPNKWKPSMPPLVFRKVVRLPCRRLPHRHCSGVRQGGSGLLGAVME